MSTPKTYLLRTYKISPGNSAGGQVERDTKGGGGIERFWNDYALTAPSGDMLVQAANRAASWLVAGERLSVSGRIEFRRVVMAEVREGQPFDLDAPTWTLIRPIETTPSGFTVPHVPPRGLRVGLRGETQAAAFLEDHAALYLSWNRRKGPTWQFWLMAGVGPDDATGTAAAALKRPQTSYRLSLNPEGTAAGFCLPWLAWTWEQVPELDAAVDIRRDGTLERVADGVRGGPMLCDVTVFNKMRRWQIQKLPAMRYLDALLARMDAKIQDALRAHGTADVGPAFDMNRGNRMKGELLFLECAYFWREFAALLGFKAQDFKEWMPTGYDWNTRYIYSDIYSQPSPYASTWTDRAETNGKWPNLPAVAVPGVLPVKQNRAQLLELVSRLAAATEWYHREKDTRKDASFPLQWNNWRTFPSIMFGPHYPKRGGLVDYTTDAAAPTPPGQEKFVYGVYSYDPLTYVYWIISPENGIDTHTSWQRQWAQAEFARWDEMEDWAFSIINALNLIELLLYPEHARRYITNRKEMRLEVPRVPATVDPTLSSAPSSVELLPYLMHHRTARPPWIRRPGTEVPPNEVSIQAPPPPPLTAEQIKILGDQRRANAKWLEHRRAFQKLGEDWELRYPSRGLVPYRSARTGEVRYLNDEAGGDPSIPEQPPTVGLPT